MAKQNEPCIFCGELPCVCNGPAPKKKARVKRDRPTGADVQPAVDADQVAVPHPRKRRASRPVEDTDTRVPVRPTRKHRTDDLIPALRALNFHGMLAPEEQDKYSEQLATKPTGKLLKEV